MSDFPHSSVMIVVMSDGYIQVMGVQLAIYLPRISMQDDKVIWLTHGDNDALLHHVIKLLHHLRFMVNGHCCEARMSGHVSSCNVTYSFVCVGGWFMPMVGTNISIIHGLVTWTFSE